MSNLKKLENKRKIYISRISEFYTVAVQSSTDISKRGQLKTRYEDISRNFDRFSEYHNEVVMLTESDGDFESQEKIRKDAEYFYYEGLSIYHSLNKTDAPITSSLGVEATAKLPPLNIPCFDGDPKTWSTFHDLFEKLIHENSNLSNVEKFRYLLSFLKDEPLKLLNGIAINNDNYNTAFKKLTDRYQNKRLIASNALDSIFSVSLKNNSAKDLRVLLNTFSESLAVLNALNFNTDAWDFLLFYILLGKLDIETRTNFEIQTDSSKIPEYKELYNFVEIKCKALESVQHLNIPKNKVASPSKEKYFNRNIGKAGNTFSLQTNVQYDSRVKCYFCKGSHTLNKCPEFTSKSPKDRVSFVKQNKLCLNCLHHSHSLQNCTSSFKCRTCNGRHHSLIHVSKNNPELSRSKIENNIPSTSITENNSISSTLSGNTYSNCSTVLLATAAVDIRDRYGSFQQVRILIDSGSQSNFISEKCFRNLELKRHEYSTAIFGLNEMSSFSSKGITSCEIKPRNSEGPVFSFDAIVIPNLCSNIPSFTIEKQQWEHLQGLPLADENYFLSRSIDILIGAELFTHILLNGRVVGKLGQPTALETIFGWVLLGKVDSVHSDLPIRTFTVQSDALVDIYIPKFWEIEQIPEKQFFSVEDEKCETFFKENFTRDPSGRFIVSLPFRNAKPNLGDTYTQARRRFLLLEKRLIKNPSLYSSYSNFMKEYLETGHMSPVTLKDQVEDYICYLPHHCVLKPESVSTKLRVVWDGSAKGSKGFSLNDTLLQGPKLQKDIVSLLLLFRLDAIVFVADIKQMFRQILISPSDRNFQRILWRFNPNDPLSEYILNTVTFGLNCSPYLAMRVLLELAKLEKENFPRASYILQHQIYIDDILGSASSESEAISLQKDLIDLLSRGGFELKKWASNSPKLLSSVSPSDCQVVLSFDKDDPPFLKVLGLQWYPSLDTFSYSCQMSMNECTKRGILSDIGRVFDPLGFLSPILLKAKYIMQCIWSMKKDWDELLPLSIQNPWKQLKSELSELSKLSLPRRILFDDFERCELHGFCDASTLGYAAVIYLRVQRADSIRVFLLCSKSRVAPLKTLTLPKLELTAGKLLADLVKFVTDTFSDRLLFDQITCWTDSQVVLSWLNGSPSRWKTFVANRVHHIQELVPPESWSYVPSSLNAADCASRGMNPSQLLSFKMWWNGPEFLSIEKGKWPIFQFQNKGVHEEVVSAEEKVISFYVEVPTDVLENLMNRFSSLEKIQRILSYCFRFSRRSRSITLKQTTFVSIQEMHESLMCLIKYTQNSAFSDLIEKLKKDCLLPKPFRRLSLFLDSLGFLRVGGRLKKSDFISYSAKHPLLLPSSNRLTTLIIESTHQQHLHPGMKTLHNLLLQQYWILSARRAIKKVISNCFRCFRVRPQVFKPPEMADLPTFRISQLKPFSHVAVDFCGPFFVTPHRMRGAKYFKSYVCVFVCTATKAIHLELTQDLSTDSFIAAFRRFISRRGMIQACYSDNGRNLVGAKNEFFDLAQKTAQKLTFEWHFSPPTGSHFNGLAEAGVKMVKSHLIRVVGDQRLSYEEYTTLICQIEAILNSRPLCSQSSDPNDLIPLTPGHFLTLEPLNSVIPEADLSHLNLNRLSRWQLIQKMQRDFWKRYFLEYVNTLQQRFKWADPAKEIEVNDLVLIKNDVVPPLKWPLGRVIEVFPGEDGHIRVATVKTAVGIFRRPIVKLCPLPKN